MSTLHQIEANRGNAQLSTGPRTGEGKRRSSLNAVKTGLTGRTVLLDSDDHAAYEAHVAAVVAKYKPEGEEERKLVGSIVDTEWRLQRIPVLEANLYALGRVEFAELFPDESEPVRKALIEAKTYATYDRSLKNLSVQEGRLTRKLEKDLDALKVLQQPRLLQRKAQLKTTALSYLRDKKAGKEELRDLAYWRENGFEFTREEWVAELVRRHEEVHRVECPEMERPAIFSQYNEHEW